MSARGGVQPPWTGARRVGGLRWGCTTMTAMGQPLILDSTSIDPRGGFVVSGLAVGNVIDSISGPELVVATLAGDLYVYELGVAQIGARRVHTWVPGGLGAYNSILIEDLDFDLRNELYAAGSQWIWKWRQK